jgi:penicillin-binding protein 1A
MDRYSGARLPDDAEGENVVAEYFRIGEEPVFGVSITDSFALGTNLKSERDIAEEAAAAAEAAATAAENGEGGEATPLPADEGKADFGTLSSGGLY